MFNSVDVCLQLMLDFFSYEIDDDYTALYKGMLTE